MDSEEVAKVGGVSPDPKSSNALQAAPLICGIRVIRGKKTPEFPVAHLGPTTIVQNALRAARLPPDNPIFTKIIVTTKI